MQTPVVPAGRRSATMPNPAPPWLWLAEIGPAHDPAWADRHADWLSASERARLARMNRPGRRAQLLAGHVLLRRLVAAKTGVQAPAVEVISDAQGRPNVVSPSGWRVSLAHSGKWVAAVADASDTAPGVDIERRQARRDIKAIVKAACGFDSASRDDAYLVWAQREAEFKAGPGSADVWLAVWDDNAIAVCARSAPQVAVLDLADNQTARQLALTWTTRPRLPAAALTQ